jgi:hypothetical protein
MDVGSPRSEVERTPNETERFWKTVLRWIALLLALNSPLSTIRQDPPPLSRVKSWRLGHLARNRMSEVGCQRTVDCHGPPTAHQTTKRPNHHSPKNPRSTRQSKIQNRKSSPPVLKISLRLNLVPLPFIPQKTARQPFRNRSDGTLAPSSPGRLISSSRQRATRPRSRSPVLPRLHTSSHHPPVADSPAIHHITILRHSIP